MFFNIVFGFISNQEYWDTPSIIKKSDNTIKKHYITGFFDAEGGVPRYTNIRFYVQFSQKNLKELNNVREILEEIGIRCGKIHNPSAEVDPDYWRFFIRAQSYYDFADKVGSWHPRKTSILLSRMKI